MNSRRKMITVLMIMMVVGLVAFFYIAGNSGGGFYSGLLLGIVIALVIVSLIVFYLKRRKIKRNLTGKYLDAFDEITQKVNTSNLSIMDKRSALQQAMELLSEASIENRDLEEVLGSADLFADDLISAYGGVRSVAKAIIRGIQFLLIYGLFLQFITWLMDLQEGSGSFFDTRTLLMTYVAYGVIVIVALPLYNIGAGRKHSILYYGLAFLIVIGVTFFFVYGARHGVLSNLYQEVVLFSGIGSVLAWAFLLVLLQLVYKRIGRASI